MIPEPSHLICPITRETFRDPVFIPLSGNTYERWALKRFFMVCRGSSRVGAFRVPTENDETGFFAKETYRDPLTNMLLPNGAMYTNWGKRREIQEFLTAFPKLVPSGWESRECLPSAKDLQKLDSAQARLYKTNSLSELFVKVVKTQWKRVFSTTTLLFLVLLRLWSIRHATQLRSVYRKYVFKIPKTRVSPFGSDIKVKYLMQQAENRGVSISIPGSLKKMFNFDPHEVFGMLFNYLWFATLYIDFAKPSNTSRSQNWDTFFSIPFFAAGIFSTSTCLKQLFSKLITSKVIVTPTKTIISRYLSLCYMRFYLSTVTCDTSLLSAENFKNWTHLSSVIFQHGVTQLSLGKNLRNVEKQFIVNTISKYIVR